MSEIGLIVKYHRKISGLSRVDCARLAGIGKTAIYDVEHGKTTIQFDTLSKLLTVLNIRIELTSPLMKKYTNEKS
ncbi:MAG: helix-turn-helix domain-containing protein [Bacteroidota bacterium]